MTPGDGIRKYGFHRWYERQLIESHLYLVTGFLSMIMVLACLEEFSLRAAGVKPLLMFGLIVGGGIVCAASLRRYLYILAHAEQLAEQSVCVRCKSSGRLKVRGASSSVEEPEAGSLRVECRQCGYQWTMGGRGAS